jgi:nicotinamidase-related amidase
MVMKPALLVQDIQNVWLYDPDSNQDLRKSVEKRLDVINEAISWFRSRHLPIIVGYTEDKEQGLLPGTKSFEVPKTVNIKETDFKATKRHASAFGNPDFGAILRNEGCDTLVIVGLSASGCVLATYFSAPDWDIRPYLLKGAVASANEEHVRFAEEICDTLSVKELDNTFR